MIIINKLLIPRLIMIQEPIAKYKYEKCHKVLQAIQT